MGGVVGMFHVFADASADAHANTYADAHIHDYDHSHDHNHDTAALDHDNAYAHDHDIGPTAAYAHNYAYYAAQLNTIMVVHQWLTFIPTVITPPPAHRTPTTAIGRYPYDYHPYDDLDYDPFERDAPIFPLESDEDRL